ncbi:MAG TPA: FtsX-like permease family protein, partial [Verrucomicrobiae bacterium]|nr:FtsX-like permease family protein [Verrucomicrobiae bacterium]
LEGITSEVLPSSLEITLAGDTRSGERLDRYISSLKRVGGIGEIQYGEEWIRKFQSFMAVLRLAGLILGAFLALTVLFIVSNTIKLTIYSRRDELELMELVGATPLFIKIPFLIEGVLQGAAGGVLALAGLFAIYQGLASSPDFQAVVPAGVSFLSPVHLAALVGGGVMAGLTGSLAALQRFMPKAP